MPVTEVTDNGIIKYSLEEYMELENSLINSKQEDKQVEPIAEEYNFTLKVDDSPAVSTHTPSYPIQSFENTTPVEMSIEDMLKLRADERRRKLKEFNHKFHNNSSRIEDLEKEPAYKRLGVDITENQTSSSNSRISLGTDSNDDIQLRSNNSFLHDNVD